MWDAKGGHPLMVAVSCQYRSIRGSVTTLSPAISSLRSTRCIPGAGSRMRFSTTHEIDLRITDHLRILALLLLVVADGWVMCNVTLIVIKTRSGVGICGSPLPAE